MILRRLAEYADRLDLPAEMYEEVGIAWIIDLTADGELEGFVPLDKVRMAVPRFRKESEPRVLSDQAKHVLGLEGGKKHSAFVELTRRCAEETSKEPVYAVLKFLENLDQVEVPEEVDGGARVVFRVEGEIVTDLPSVQRFWAHYSVRDDAVEGTCLVTGYEGYVEQVLPGKIKRVPKTLGSGAAIVSAKHDSTHHYSLDQSLNMPISRRAAERYTVALNSLLLDEERHVFVVAYGSGQGATYVFWSKAPQAQGEFYAMLVADAPEEVRDLLLSPKKRTDPPRGLDSSAFYTLVLTGNQGRVVVRDFRETTVGEVKENVTHWFEAQQITYPDGAEGKPLKIFPLAGSCYADKKDMQPRILTELWNTALRGESPPAELLSRAVRRNRAEGDISRPRAALMQMILRYTAKGGEIMEQHVAYHCGRLLAELEAVQEAVRGKGNTNVERHFGMASTTPATAFGMLLRLSQPHMSTLRRDKPHLAPILQGRIEEITAEIGTEFPRTLTLPQQAIFALGYYNQRAWIKSHRKARAQARNRVEEEVS